MFDGNPALKDAFDERSTNGKVMTLQGAVTKTMILTALTIGSAAFSWSSSKSHESAPLSFALIAALVAFLLGLWICFQKSAAPLLAPMYAVVEGAALGIVSMHYERQYKGIVAEALALTLLVLAALLVIYKLRIIKPDQNFWLAVTSATGAIALYYLADLLVGSFGIHLPLLHSNGWGGILFSLIVVCVAAANLVLDFDFIEEGARTRAPKYMEWYSGFGLLLTIIWLYLELLKLLAKAKSRD